MEKLQQLHQTLRDYIRPLTTPVSVSLLKKGEELPPKAKRPSQFFGYRMALCQGFSFARKYGWSTAFGLEDMGCGPALAYFGFVERPEFEVEGGLVHPMYAKTMEAGRRSEDVIDKLKADEIETVLIEPIDRATRVPDVILIYCNAAQIARLTQGALYCTGGAIETKVAGRCACSPEVITPYLTQNYNVVVPDGGERMFALTGDDELVFSVPYCKIPELTEGIVTTHKSGVARYPYPAYGLRMEPRFPERYEAIVKLAEEKGG